MAAGGSRVQENDLLLHEAVIMNELEAVRTALKRWPTDVNCRNNYARAPIHWAASRGNVEIIRLLIEAKCDIEATDKYGMTPLLMSSYHGNFDAVKLFVKTGACLNVKNKNQQDMLICACARGHLQIALYAISLGAQVQVTDADGDTPLAHAAKAGFPDVIEMLLDNGATVNTTNKVGQTPLHLACRDGRENTVVLLVSKGADVKACDNTRRTPLHEAANMHTNIVKILLEAGCDPNAKDSDGRTALHMACHMDCRRIVVHLLEHGADVNLQDNDGSTALHAAWVVESQDIISLLLKNGADPTITDKWSFPPCTKDGRPSMAPPTFRRAARGSFEAILDLLAATTNLDQHDQPAASTSAQGEAKSSEAAPAAIEGTHLNVNVFPFLNKEIPITRGDGRRQPCWIVSRSGGSLRTHVLLYHRPVVRGTESCATALHKRTRAFQSDPQTPAAASTARRADPQPPPDQTQPSLRHSLVPYQPHQK